MYRLVAIAALALLATLTVAKSVDE